MTNNINYEKIWKNIIKNISNNLVRILTRPARGDANAVRPLARSDVTTHTTTSNDDSLNISDVYIQ